MFKKIKFKQKKFNNKDTKIFNFNQIKDKKFFISCLIDVVTFLIIFIGGFSLIFNFFKTNNKVEDLQENVALFKSQINTAINDYGSLLTTSLDAYESDKAELFTIVNSCATKSELENFKIALENSFVNGEYLPVQMHANFYRGKNLGQNLTSIQRANIENGSFKDLFVGDFWTINNTVYRIADINYFYNVGDEKFLENHLVIVPDKAFYCAEMNDTATVSGGYISSKMYEENLEEAKIKITNDFSDSIMTHRDRFCIERFDSSVSPCAFKSTPSWYDSSIELMNEIMVYGRHISGYGSHETTTVQLALFRLSSDKILCGSSYWLRDPVSYNCFAAVSINGISTDGFANGQYGVRPYFLVG